MFLRRSHIIKDLQSPKEEVSINQFDSSTSIVIQHMNDYFGK